MRSVAALIFRHACVSSRSDWPHRPSAKTRSSRFLCAACLLCTTCCYARMDAKELKRDRCVAVESPSSESASAIWFRPHVA